MLLKMKMEELFANVLPGLVFFILGLILRFFPPKKINMIYGYRTPFSLKTIDTFRFANQLSGRLMINFGIISMMIGLSITFFFRIYQNTQALLAVAQTLIISVLVLILTEIRLRKNFNNSGNKKNSQ